MLFQLRPGLMAAVMFLSVLGSFTGALHYLYQHAHHHQEAALKSTVRQLSATAAALVDVEFHEQLQEPSQISGEIYAKALEPLVKMHLKHPEAHYIYTMRVNQAQDEYFVLDTANDSRVQSILEALGREALASGLLEPYEIPDNEAMKDARATMLKGLSYVYEVPYQDDYGSFISAQSPLFDKAGRYVGYAGVDYSLNAFHARMSDLRRTGAISLGAAFLLSLALAHVAYGVRLEAVQKIDQVRDAETRMREEKDRAELAVADKADLLAMAAHDLKNPLSAISGLADLSLAKLDPQRDSTLHEQIKLISDASQHMSELVSNILIHEGLEHRGLALNPEPVHVGELVERVIHFNQTSAKRKNIAIEAQLEPGLLAELDVTRMHEAFDNLLSNAVKYSPLGSRIKVTLEAVAEHRELRFSVRDEGPGLSVEDQAKLFRKFSKLSSVPSGGELQTGLGLSIAKSIVEKHGGRIGCDTKLGEGSTFWVTLSSRSCHLKGVAESAESAESAGA